MEPVRIKLYGLFPITKRRYVRQLVLTLLLLAVLMGMWWYLPLLLPPERAVPAHLEWALWGLRNLHWIAAALGGIVLVEAVLTFRAFAHAEAARREMMNA